ncbi:hypothetical protein [Haloplanus pelagicus]|jgi:hypothetical protein|uniref:hypothetical protein n=1 Tax=Haloplanus pelagicus TaxID=2949995 RepID=UPI00203BAD2B|nr:hypothetical protein [Haloplanus sp. HW8-1]
MRRLVIGVALCLVLLTLVVGFGVRFNGSEAYPDPAAIDGNYATHVGETVHLWTGVAGERNGSLVVSAGPLRLQVTEPPPSAVDSGDLIQVYGVLRPGHRMDTTAYHVQTAADQRYMYAASVAGVALAALAFLRRWRVDVRGLRFVPREGE